MTTDEMMDVLENVHVPGMNVMGNEWFREDDNEMQIVDPDIFNMGNYFQQYHLFDKSDSLIDSVRFGVCDAVGAVIHEWHDRMGTDPDVPKEEYDQFPPAFKRLWDECMGTYNPTSIPWAVFRDGLREIAAYDGSSNFDSACDSVLEQDWDRRWELEVRHKIELCPDDVSYKITTQIGGGWQGVWGATYTFTVSKYATRQEFVKAINFAYPDYLVEDVE